MAACSRCILTDHGLPASGHLRTDFGVIDAVARARARALPFHAMRDPDSLPPPGAVLYLDYAGPMTPSYPHKFTYYCGVVDAGSQYSRVYACHGPTKEVARRAQESLIADISALMGLTHLLKAQVVVSDQGSAFMSHYFRDFLSESQTRHWPSTAYRAQHTPNRTPLWSECGGLVSPSPAVFSPMLTLDQHGIRGPFRQRIGISRLFAPVFETRVSRLASRTPPANARSEAVDHARRHEEPPIRCTRAHLVDGARHLGCCGRLNL